MLQPLLPRGDVGSATPVATAVDVRLLGPLKVPLYRGVWISDFLGNLGTWAQSVAVAWVVTATHGGPLLVALVQVAASAPLLLLSLAAGGAADNFDRRRLIILGESIELSGTIALTLLAFTGHLHPWLLIALTFYVSIGSAIIAPAWQAAVGDLVPRALVPAAVLLNSVDFNAARAIGPALGGVLLSLVGASWVFLINVFSYAGLFVVIGMWRPKPAQRRLPPEGIFEAIHAGLRFARHSPVARIVMLRSFVFGFGGSAVWALLPLVAQQQVKGGSLTYGVLLGALGGGAILGSLLVGRLRARLGSSRLLMTSALLCGLSLVAVGLEHRILVLVPTLAVTGACWLAALSTYNTAVQLLVPEWVKGRALALYQTALYGGLTFGSFGWGQVAELVRVPGSLVAAGIFLVLWGTAIGATRRLGLPEFGSFDLTPAPLSDAEPGAEPTDIRRGKVLVSVDYNIPSDRTRAFVAIAPALRELRLRNGALYWSLVRDVHDPNRWQELYLVDNWLQHLRLLDRLTADDRRVIDTAASFHAGDGPPPMRRAVSYELA